MKVVGTHLQRWQNTQKGRGEECNDEVVELTFVGNG